MNEQCSNEVEEQIKNLLITETRPSALSNLLFTPDGLFSRLAATESERREIVRTPLFQQALRRVSELERAEILAAKREVNI